MGRANGELEPAGLKADDHRRARELLGRATAVRFNRRNNDLARQAPEGDFAGVIKEPGPLFVAARASRDIGEKNLPPTAEDLHKPVQIRQVISDFLDGDQVEPADDLGQAIKRLVVATAVFCPDRKSTRLNSSHGYISYA